MKSREAPRGRRPGSLPGILAVVAMAAAITLPVVLLSVGGGVSSHEIARLQASGYQIVVSAPGNPGIDLAHQRINEIGAISGVAAVSPTLTMPVDWLGPGGRWTPLLAEGIVPAAYYSTLGTTASQIFSAPPNLGDPTDMIHYDNGTYDGPLSPDVLVNTTLAQIDHLTIGDTLTLAPAANATGEVTYTVTGTFNVVSSFLSTSGNYGVYMPLSNLQVLTGLARTGPGGLLDAADSIHVGLQGVEATDPAAIVHVEQEIHDKLPYYGVSTLTQQASQLEGAASILNGFYLALSSIGLAIGFVFLTLVLVRRVEAERREVGIRRAMGLPASSIAATIVARGELLGGAGALLGVAGGILTVTILARFGSAPVRAASSLAVFDPGELVAITLGALALAAVASLVAVRRAVRLPVVEALR
jgi:ABC-type lipoprotein release transport system permease subunit